MPVKVFAGPAGVTVGTVENSPAVQRMVTVFEVQAVRRTVEGL
jgi:hypothetical protein